MAEREEGRLEADHYPAAGVGHGVMSGHQGRQGQEVAQEEGQFPWKEREGKWLLCVVFVWHREI